MHAAIQTPPAPPAPNFAAAKQKQQAAWSAGDYAIIGTTLQIVGETLCEAIDLPAGAKVLDVAAGNGNATLAAARRFADVTSTDYVASLLDRGRDRAQAERLPVRFQVADAEDLPFDDGAFDVTLSTFGVMFTPNQERAAAELVRVTRKGGTIGMANWTPDSFIGQVFKTLGRHIPPAPGLQSPARWGDADGLESLFGGRVGDLRIAPARFIFRYRSFAHFLTVFRDYYGPLHKAFLALGDGAAALEEDLRTLHQRFNRATDGSFVVDGDYAQVIIRT